MINQDESKLTTADRIKALSDYVQFNLSAFHNLKSKHYKAAMDEFEKCIELAKEIDDIKHVESLTNFGICQFFSGIFEEAFDCLEKAKEISSRLNEDSPDDKQIQYLHLRVLANLSLTALSLNKITECRAQFSNCLEMIRSCPRHSDQVDMLHELIFIFFRLDSLIKYYETNQNNFDNNVAEDMWNDNSQTKMINKCFFSLHKTLKENNISYWLKALTEELSKCNRNKDYSGYVFLLINKISASFCFSGKVDEGIKTTMTKLIESYHEQYNKDLKFKEKSIVNILNDFKSRIDTSVEIYKAIWDLEGELLTKSQLSNDQNDKRKENKFLIKLIFKHALNFLGKEENRNDEVRSQIQDALKLLDNDEIDCSMIKILNINSEITKSLKILIKNIGIIFTKVKLKRTFITFKYNTLNYFTMQECMERRYDKANFFLQNKLDELAQGTKITKCHFSSKGTATYYYKVALNKENKHALLVYKSSEGSNSNKKPLKSILLSEVTSISYGCNGSDNLKKKLIEDQLKAFKPWLFLSFHLARRSIDLYFSNDEVMNGWYLGLYYYAKTFNKSIAMSINSYFFHQLKQKLLFNLLNTKGNLEILTQLATFSQGNPLEFQSIPFLQVLLLHSKVTSKLSSTNQLNST